MKRLLQYALALLCSLSATAASTTAQERQAKPSPATAHHVVTLPPRGAAHVAGRSASTSNLIDNGGLVIISAKVVFIFWGPSFSDAASPDLQYAQTLQAFRNQFGTTPEYNVITQYTSRYQLQVYGMPGHIQLSNLGSGTPDWFDTSTPPTEVTYDAVVSEVYNYFQSLGLSSDSSTVYEVVIPSSSYAYLPSPDRYSCGGPPSPNQGFCAYHDSIGTGPYGVAFSLQPYPSCGACGTFGWSAVQNQEHFVGHETREAVTDPQPDFSYSAAWKDRSGSEADDKCAWRTFIGTGGYGYQQEWSNQVSDCVKTR